MTFRKHSKAGFSRRNFLKGVTAGALGLGAASVGATSRLARAQSEQPGGPLNAFSRFTVGELQLTAIQEGAAALPPEFVAANAPEEAASLLEEQNLPPQAIPLSINPLLVTSGDRTILLDTGYGQYAAGFPGGAVVPTLALLGIEPELVTDVIISHHHNDHIGGISNDDGPAFPNARYHFPQPELEFLEAGPVGNELLDAQIQFALERLQPVMDADQLQLYNDEDELVPGIQALFTPGHTLGHCSFLLSSGGEQLFCTVDVAIHVLLSLARPDFVMLADADPELAIETRRAVFNRAVDEKLKVSGYHFPFNSVGYVTRDGDGFRFEPTGI